MRTNDLATRERRDIVRRVPRDLTEETTAKAPPGTTPEAAETPSAGDADVSLLGSALGRYRITAVLGQGGMGVVYLAEDETLRREVALKVLSAELSHADDWHRRLLREAQAAAAVSHPNIAAVYDVGEHDGRFYIAMERVRGMSLRERLDRGRLSVEEAVRLAKLLLEGLATAHDAGIIHRDLKPDNVMVDDAGQLKILDFGLAKFLEKARPRVQGTAALTVEGQFMGTPSYMSPEQAAGLPVDTRSDVFSYGIVLYEMLVGEKPFDGTNVLKILAAIERDEPVAPTLKNPDIPRSVERVIFGCLKKDPAERYADAREVLAAFEREKTLDREPPPRPVTSRKRSKMLGIVAVAALVGAALLLGWAGRKAGQGAAPNSSASASTVAAPVPTPITALPPSKTDNAQALAAYREGMQALRDSSWVAADKAFAEAAKLDPSFASAHLRVALTRLSAGTIPDDGRVSFRKAVSLRADLSERDRWLLDTLAFVYLRDPPDVDEARKKVLEAHEHYPLDAEFLMMAYSIYYATTVSPDSQLKAAERCLELDPQYADCVQLRAWALEHLGRPDEAIRVYDHCVSVSPAGSDCLVEKVMLHMRTGQCVAMEETARHVQQMEQDPRHFISIGAAMLARHQDVQVVRAVIGQAWESLPEPQRSRARLSDDIKFALLTGRMEDAEKGFLDVLKQIDKNPLQLSHLEAAKNIIEFYRVMNRSKDAAAAADAYLTRVPLFTKGIFFNVFPADFSLYFLKIKTDGGLLPRETFVAERARWMAHWQKKLEEDKRPAAWLRGYVETISTQQDAEEALAAKPEGWKFVEYYGGAAPSHHSNLATMYLLTGRPAEAIPHLEKLLGDCGVYMHPIATVVAQHQLGKAREAMGDKAAACAAYGAVLERWGQAKPPIPVAEESRQRVKALDCKKN